MPKPMSYNQISSFLLENGFSIKRQNGSHVIFIGNSKTIIVPKHGNKDIPGPTINSILKQAGIK